MATPIVPDTSDAAEVDGTLPLRFELLGPFRVLHNGKPIDVGGATAQAVLVALLQHRNQKISVQKLTDDVWGRENTTDPVTVYHYVKGLRKALKPTD